MPILTWLNDEEARKTSSRVPYRLLEADEALSYGDPNTENMLIQGDNLEALKALLPYVASWSLNTKASTWSNIPRRRKISAKSAKRQATTKLCSSWQLNMMKKAGTFTGKLRIRSSRF